MVTLAAGFQGGEVTPLFSIGASLGVLLGTLCGLPTAFVAALGYAAVFGSTTALLAPMLIGGEVFGFAYLPYFFVVCAVAYLCNGGSCICSGRYDCPAEIPIGGTHMDVFYQLIGLGALAAMALSFYQKGKRQIMVWQMAAFACFILHYGLIGALSGALCNVVPNPLHAALCCP